MFAVVNNNNNNNNHYNNYIKNTCMVSPISYKLVLYIFVIFSNTIISFI